MPLLTFFCNWNVWRNPLGLVTPPALSFLIYSLLMNSLLNSIVKSTDVDLTSRESHDCLQNRQGNAKDRGQTIKYLLGSSCEHLDCNHFSWPQLCLVFMKSEWGGKSKLDISEQLFPIPLFYIMQEPTITEVLSQINFWRALAKQFPWWLITIFRSRSSTDWRSDGHTWNFSGFREFDLPYPGEAAVEPHSRTLYC